jgi:hypothetical protein
MRLDVRGHPLHTRSLSVVLTQRADRRLDAQGTLLDLRKRGFVPVAGDLQGSGIVHLMRLDAIVDPARATLDSIVAAQPAVAFEPAAITEGESCRDPIHAVEALAGAPLDADFARRTGAALGGPRGCSHILTLAHLLGSTVAWALARERALHADGASWAAGQRVFRRDVVVDGVEPEDGGVGMAVQLTDLHLEPAGPHAKPMERFAEELEVRALAHVDLSTFRVAALETAERRRGAADLAHATWRSRAAATDPLVGLGLGAGVTAALLARLGEDPDDRPLLDALLQLAPTLVQCAAALSDTWPALAQSNPSVIGLGGLPDSCYMWRREGPLQRLRDREGGSLSARPKL